MNHAAPEDRPGGEHRPPMVTQCGSTDNQRDGQPAPAAHHDVLDSARLGPGERA
jgi:hypothetical protein